MTWCTPTIPHLFLFSSFSPQILTYTHTFFHVFLLQKRPTSAQYHYIFIFENFLRSTSHDIIVNCFKTTNWKKISSDNSLIARQWAVGVLCHGDTKVFIRFFWTQVPSVIQILGRAWWSGGLLAFFFSGYPSATPGTPTKGVCLIKEYIKYICSFLPACSWLIIAWFHKI